MLRCVRKRIHFEMQQKKFGRMCVATDHCGGGGGGGRLF